jgi:hypothetical protein
VRTAGVRAQLLSGRRRQRADGPGEDWCGRRRRGAHRTRRRRETAAQIAKRADNRDDISRSPCEPRVRPPPHHLPPGRPVTRQAIVTPVHRRRAAADAMDGVEGLCARAAPRRLAMTAIAPQTQTVSSQSDSRRIVIDQRLPARLLTLRAADVCNRPPFGGAFFGTVLGLFAAARRVVLLAMGADFLGHAVRCRVLLA